MAKYNILDIPDTVEYLELIDCIGSYVIDFPNSIKMIKINYNYDDGKKIIPKKYHKLCIFNNKKFIDDKNMNYDHNLYDNLNEKFDNELSSVF